MSLTIARDTDGLTAMVAPEPALSSVSTSWWYDADSVSLAPPLNVAPSSIAARTMLSSRTWIAADAPMPTLPALASESALAPSSSLLCAFRVTSPEVMVTLAVPDKPAPTIASLWSWTMFSAKAPATLTLLPSPPEAPDLASAEMSCAARRYNSPVLGPRGNAVPSPRKFQVEPSLL